MTTYAVSVSEFKAHCRPYLDESPQSSYEAIGAALAKLQLSRIEKWKHVKALDGGPVIDSSPYNDYTFWDSLGYGDIPFELLVTNQIIASAEYRGAAAHSAVRGGYTNGITINNEHSRFRTTSIWSTFAFTSEDDWVVQVRNGERYEPQEAVRLAGIIATHEIGHQQFHLGHPFGWVACIMNPIPMFAYRASVDGLSAKDCLIGSSPAMRPGASKFWVRQRRRPTNNRLWGHRINFADRQNRRLASADFSDRLEGLVSSWRPRPWPAPLCWGRLARQAASRKGGSLPGHARRSSSPAAR